MIPGLAKGPEVMRGQDRAGSPGQLVASLARPQKLPAALILLLAAEDFVKASHGSKVARRLRANADAARFGTGGGENHEMCLTTHNAVSAFDPFLQVPHLQSSLQQQEVLLKDLEHQVLLSCSKTYLKRVRTGKVMLLLNSLGPCL